MRFPHPATACLAGFFLLMTGIVSSRAQLTPSQVDQIKSLNESRVASFDVLAGDYGLSGGSYSKGNSGNNVGGLDANISKFGGWGDIGLGPTGPAPLGDTGIGWQPRVQGSMGYMTANKTYTYAAPQVAGDELKYNTFAIQFGGGARFWFSDRFSFTPTIMGMYGHVENEYDRNGLGLTQAQYNNAVDAGLIGWNVDTWTLRPAGELAYNYVWRRTIFTLSSAGTYYHTESFSSSSSNFSINSDADTWANKLDVDVPLGVELFGHELRTGGYFSRTDFFGDLQTGMGSSYLYDIHGRLTLDFLDQLWKVQWLGIGVSYLWGQGGLSGITYGLDACFRF